MLQLSPFVLPQVRVGALRLTTINMRPHPERVSYVRGLVASLEELLRLMPQGLVDREGIERFHDRSYLGKMVASIDWDAPGGARVVPWEHAEDFVTYDADRAGVMLLDGRQRDEREMVFLPTGAATPDFAAVVTAMARGAPEHELLAIAARHEVDLDADFLALLVERGVLEEVADPRARIAPRFAPVDDVDRVTWFGVAGVVFQSGPTSVWFDPLLPPRIRFRPEEVARAFSPDLANAVFTPPPYGPDCEQLTVGDLPVPDAIVISRDDVVVFDLGLLMCVPDTVPIVVPASRPDRPWSVDMTEVIARIVGPRRVIRLAHGETVTFGDVRITAVPYAGEWPAALPTDWNCHVVEGRHATAVLTHHAALPAEHAEIVAERIRAHGKPAALLTYGLFDGDATMIGWREAAEEPYALNRAWPWYVRIEQLFDPSPRQGVHVDVLDALRERAGLARWFPYGSGGAPWMTFERPHVHRYYIRSINRASYERQVALARSIGVETLPIQIGVPCAL